MARKEFIIPEETLNVLHEIMEERGFKTEVSAIIFLINQYKDNTKLADDIVKKIHERYENLFTNIRLSAGASQKNTYMLLDAFNSFLYDTETVDLYKALGAEMHPILKQSEEDYKKMIEARKQKKDNERGKKGK